MRTSDYCDYEVCEGVSQTSSACCGAFCQGDDAKAERGVCVKNAFWIFYRRKNCYDLVIDIYDCNYMERPREERFSELKRILANDIMNIRRVHIQGDDNGAYLEIGKSLLAIERIVKIHHLIENVYTWLTPWFDKNPVFDNGMLALDETLDNSLIPHYKVLTPKRRNRQQDKHEEGELYVKADGEVYTIVYDTERRVCELVWEAFQGEIPQGHRVCHIDGDKQNNRLDNLKLVEE